MPFKIDICIVVFRPRLVDLEMTLDSLSMAHDEFRLLHVLVSGGESLHRQVQDMVSQKFDSAKVNLIMRFDNIGFAAGQNLLLAKAFGLDADYGIVYNPDIVVERNGFTELMTVAPALPERVIFGPWLLKRRVADSCPGLIDSRGIEWTKDGRHFDIGADEETFDISVDPRQVDAVSGITGACMVASRDAFEYMLNVSGEFFDETFIAYREDAELCVRAASVGVPSFSVPSNSFLHNRGVPKASRSNTFVNMLSVRNRFLMRFKLGATRPGKCGFPTLRDLTVLAACLSIERDSFRGLRSAIAIRRSMRYKGFSTRALSAMSDDRASGEIGVL